MIFEEKHISSQTIYEGAILNVKRDKVTACGGEAYREIIEHNGAVCMVPITDEGKVVMVEQYRYVMGRVVLEIPAGKIDAGETDPMKTAIRELREETGYTASDIRKLGVLCPSVAYSKEKVTVFGMAGLTPGEMDLDEDEALNVKFVDFDEIYQMATMGEIEDVKTIAAICMAKEQMSDVLK